MHGELDGQASFVDEYGADSLALIQIGRARRAEDEMLALQVETDASMTITSLLSFDR